MTKLYLLAGRLDNDTQRALLAAAGGRPEPGWEVVRTGSRDTVLSGPDHFIKFLAPTLLSRASGLAPARLLIAIAGRGARLARREHGMNARGVSTAPIQARGLIAGREFLLTARAPGQTLHALLPTLGHADKHALTRALACAVADLHDSGIYHGDLNCYNLITAIPPTGQPYTFTFLDNDSSRLGRQPVNEAMSLKNLSQLNFWHATGKLGRTDRLRFLETYLRTRALTERRNAWWRDLAERFSQRQQRKRGKTT